MLKLNRLFATALAIAVVGTAASSASATSCRDWSRMTEDQRWNRIYRMIDDAISGQRGRQYDFNRAAIARCLEGDAQRMFWDFDDTCADSRTADTQAIRRLFKSYIWSCVR